MKTGPGLWARSSFAAEIVKTWGCSKAGDEGAKGAEEDGMIATLESAR